MVNDDIRLRFFKKEKSLVLVKKKILKKIGIINSIANILIKTLKNKKKYFFVEMVVQHLMHSTQLQSY